MFGQATLYYIQSQLAKTFKAVIAVRVLMQFLELQFFNL